MRFAITILLLIAATALHACAAPQRGLMDSTGIALDVLVERDDSVALYRVAADGTIAFAGGYDARLRRFSWTDDLKFEEIEGLRSNLQSPFWREPRRDAGRPDAGEQRVTVTVHQPLRSRVIIRGEEPKEVRALHEWLRSAAARRFDPELEALPKPGPRR